MVASFGLIAGYSGQAAACETDEDCGAGYVCVTHEWEEMDCDYTMPDCEDGDDDCLEEAERSMEDCETRTVAESFCERAPCETDADCGEAMVCIEHVDEWCTGSAMEVCDETGEQCEIIEEEEECGTEVHRECGYPYEGDCEQDADCGPGFSCIPREICSCSGTDMDTEGMDDEEDMGSDGDEGIPPMPEEDPGEPAPGDEGSPPDCTCAPTDVNYCELQQIDCETDADCPAGLLCSPAYSISECQETPDGDEICTEIETVSQCEPAGWYDEEYDKGSDGDGESAGDVPGDDDLPRDEEADQDDTDDDGEAGEGEGWGWGWGWQSPRGPRGCSVVAPGAGSASGAALLGLFGLLAVVLTRRR